MNKSLSFDRAAGYYDQTRPLPELIAQRGIQAILEITGDKAQILDVGTGTGRVSIPLLEHGTDLVGCDLSSKMLNRLQAKYASARLTQADAALLPFPGGHFDALLTVHVIHLISPWQEALQEFKRVLKSGGVYLNVRTYASTGSSIREKIRTFWRGWVEDRGVQIFQPGVSDFQEFLHGLKSLGADLSEVEVLRFPHRYTLQEELDRLNARIYSDAWHIPDDVYDASMHEVQAWVAREFGDLNKTREDEVRFVINVARFS